MQRFANVRIAFISFEFPPDTAWGGIATYVKQAAGVLSSRGHAVEVFSASPSRDESATEGGYVVHRLRETDPVRFGQRAGQAFVQRHLALPFDVVEGPDWGADAREAVRLVPAIPLVVKLHTPALFAFRITHARPSGLARLLSTNRAWLRDPPPPETADDRLRLDVDRAFATHADVVERSHALDADAVVAPSAAIGAAARRIWNVPKDLIHHVPNPFVPDEALLAVEPGSGGSTVAFIGRLEVLKGVLDLASAIPRVLSRSPAARFRFIGPSDVSPRDGITMRAYLEESLSPWETSVEFVGEVPAARIPAVLAEADICTFPSRWDNFPNVCLEAMAAARPIVATRSGGMVEMLDAGRCGVIVPPGDPARLASAILTLLAQPARRAALGRAARTRLLTEYSATRIGARTEAIYQRAIERRLQRGPRA
jgi:glycogen synthase